MRLIEAVFGQLRAGQPGNVEYKVVRPATPPVPTAADIIGSYYPAVPVTGVVPGDRSTVP